MEVFIMSPSVYLREYFIFLRVSGVMPNEIDFGFPGIPYPVQIEFMKFAYEAMTAGALCAMESPTGTGKSLSLICSSLAWLRDNRATVLAERILKTCDSKSQMVPNWIRRQVETNSMTEAVDLIAHWDKQKVTTRGRVQRLTTTDVLGSACVTSSCIKRKTVGATFAAELEEDNFLPLDESTRSFDTPEPMQTERARRVKVIIASRTHSQLSQLIRELKRTKFKDQFSVVTLGSRLQLCTNSSISKENSSAVVNDLCRKLVDDDKCKLKASIAPLQDVIVTTPLDIEDMVTAGKAPSTTGCSYFAARAAESMADVILVPYSILVNERTRLAMGLDIDDNIVVIDEAHSILDMINSTRSVGLLLSELEMLQGVLKEYDNVCAIRLSPKNRVSFKQLQFLIRRLISFATLHAGEVLPIDGFTTTSRIGEMDITAVLIFLEEGLFSRKLTAFGRTLTEYGFSSPPIYSVSAFLLAVQCASDPDRVFVKHTEGIVSIEFTAINAESQLAIIAKQARSLMLVSGTMRPFGEYEAVAALAACPFRSFSGTYKVADSRLFSRVVSRSREGTELKFNAESRSQLTHTTALCDLLELCITAGPKGGIVIFAASYGYCAELSSHLNGVCLRHKVPFFADSGKSKASDLLREYTHAIRSCTCAVLLSVVNGSLSEGIDFKDELCRCVVMVGLPYPNPSDPILKERMLYFDTQHSRYPKFPTGKSYYASRCVKSINQAIGRSIRNSTDWSAIILLDTRFGLQEIRESLPVWVNDVTIPATGFDTLRDDLGLFFRRKT